jgi:N-acetylmuramic acid 6-phosphate etherase
MKKITESTSRYNDLEKMEVHEIVASINREDQLVAQAVGECLPAVERLIEAILPNFSRGGRLFYLGAGTSGRLGVVDASEIPPTFGMPHDRVIGLIAGGDGAIRKAVEFAEDSRQLAANDLDAYQLSGQDALIGIAASGTTPYVIGGVEHAAKKGCVTGCITNNAGSPLALAVQHPIEALVGPEFVTGSTRMKSGTAQKMVLNIVSTALMIKIGRVKGNKMVNMQLNNNKLVARGVRFIEEELGIPEEEARKLLNRHGSVRKALEAYKQ